MKIDSLPIICSIPSVTLARSWLNFYKHFLLPGKYFYSKATVLQKNVWNMFQDFTKQREKRFWTEIVACFGTGDRGVKVSVMWTYTFCYFERFHFLNSRLCQKVLWIQLSPSALQSVTSFSQDCFNYFFLIFCTKLEFNKYTTETEHIFWGSFLSCWKLGKWVIAGPKINIFELLSKSV